MAQGKKNLVDVAIFRRIIPLWLLLNFGNFGYIYDFLKFYDVIWLSNPWEPRTKAVVSEKISYPQTQKTYVPRVFCKAFMTKKKSIALLFNLWHPNATWWENFFPEITVIYTLFFIKHQVNKHIEAQIWQKIRTS